MSIFARLFRMFLFVVLTPLIPLAAVLFFYQNYSKTEKLETHANLARIASSTMAQHIEDLNWRMAFTKSLEDNIGNKKERERILREAIAANPDFLMLSVFDAQDKQMSAAGIKFIVDNIKSIDNIKA